MARTPWRIGGIVLSLALVLWLAPAIAEPTFPALTGRVVDDAKLLSDVDEQALTADLKALEDKSSDQLVVVTLPRCKAMPSRITAISSGAIGASAPKQLNNGVLLIVAPNERKVRIEVGRGLEPILTDALSKIIIENAILPRFRAGDFAGGIKDGVRDITLALTGDAAELEERAKARHDADNPTIDWMMVIFWSLIILWFIWVMWRSAQQPGVRGRQGSGPDFIPGPGWGGSSGRRRLGRRWRRLLRRRWQLRRRRRLGRLVGDADAALQQGRACGDRRGHLARRVRRRAARSSSSWRARRAVTSPSG